MKINIGLVDDEQGRCFVHHNESEHLTAHLKAKASPEYLSVHSLLWAEHVEQGLFMSCINFWLLNVHPWPCGLNKRAELIERIGVVIPNVTEVSGRAMGK